MEWMVGNREEKKDREWIRIPVEEWKLNTLGSIKEVSGRLDPVNRQ
jgi:hypothetical protein